MQTKTFYLQSLTALHVGTGQGVGVVDLPIARSKATNLPLVPGSSLKGVLRDELAVQQSLDAKDVNTLFGPDTQTGDSFAGALSLSDANLLILPLRSFAGTVAYATCPFILKRYARDFKHSLNVPATEGDLAIITTNSKLEVATESLALEDLDISSERSNDATDWAELLASELYPDSVLNAAEWRSEFIKRFVILPDNIFSFLVDTATEIRTRIRINRETRIVKDGALWTEENLPAESVLWGVLGVNRSFNKENQKSEEEMMALLPTEEMMIQVGGKHTVGRGMCRFLITQTQEG